MTLHRVFGTGQPYPQVVGDDGDPDITLATMFYLLGSTGTWTCVGGRLHVPNDARANGKAVTISAWTTVLGSPVNLSDTPAASVATVAPPAGGWVAVEWVVPIEIDNDFWIGIGYHFNGAPDVYLHSDVSIVGTDPRQAPGGAPLYMAGSGETGGRSRFRIGAGATAASTAWYGVDIEVSDGVLPPFAATYVDGLGVIHEGELWVDDQGTPKQVSSAVKT